MKDKLPLIARLLLGLLFVASGIGGLVAEPPPLEGPVGDFTAIMQSSYLLVLVKVVEIACGLLLLVGRFVPLALVVLAPIVVNILFFHATLQPAGIGPGLVAAVLGIYLAWVHRAAFAALLRARHGG